MNKIKYEPTELAKWVNTLDRFPLSYKQEIVKLSPWFSLNADKVLFWGNYSSYELHKILKDYYDQLSEIEQLLLVK